MTRSIPQISCARRLEKDSRNCFKGGIIIISHEDLLQCKTLPSPPNGDWFCSNHFLLKSRCTATCSNGFLLFSEMVEHGSENQERIDINSTEEGIDYSGSVIVDHN